MINFQNPVISNTDLEKIRNISVESFKAETIEMLYSKSKGLNGLEDALDAIIVKIEKALERGTSIYFPWLYLALHFKRSFTYD